jgi:hypothetical protein
MTTYHQNMGKQAPYGMTGTVHTRIPGGGIPMSKDKDAEREAYQRVLAELYERMRRIRNESAGRIITLLETEIERGEWPKGEGE